MMGNRTAERQGENWDADGCCQATGRIASSALAWERSNE